MTSRQTLYKTTVSTANTDYTFNGSIMLRFKGATTEQMDFLEKGMDYLIRQAEKEKGFNDGDN